LSDIEEEEEEQETSKQTFNFDLIFSQMLTQDTIANTQTDEAAAKDEKKAKRKEIKKYLMLWNFYWRKQLEREKSFIVQDTGPKKKRTTLKPTDEQEEKLLRILIL